MTFVMFICTERIIDPTAVVLPTNLVILCGVVKVNGETPSGRLQPVPRASHSVVTRLATTSSTSTTSSATSHSHQRFLCHPAFCTISHA